MDELLSDDDTQFAYYNPNDPESILTAIQDLSIYVDQEGPFDGVMGFSQGAALGAMLLARNNHPSFSFGIFICSGAPLCESGLSKGALHPLRPDINGEPIKVPTAHIIGGKDASLPESLACAAVCAEALRTVYDHGAGHEIPLGAVGNNKVGEMVSCIQKVITRAEFMQ